MTTLKHIFLFTPVFIVFTLAPWVFNPAGKWIFELPKSRVIYIGLLLMILTATFVSRKIHLSRLQTITCLYLLLVGITGLWSTSSLETAFWGTYTRQLGFIAYLHLFIAPFFFAEVMQKLSSRIFYTCIAWGSLGASLLALSQYTTWSVFAPVHSFGFRLYGSFGEPNLLGYYLVLTLFPIWQVFKEYTWKQTSKYFYLFILLLNCWTILDSGSRGAMVALLASIILLMLHHSKIIFYKYSRQTAIVGFILLFIFGTVIASQIQDRHSYLNLRIMNNVTVAIRTQIWSHTIEEANKKWLWGHGTESLQHSFVIKSPELSKLLYDPSETIDRAHNDALDHYYNGGIIGLFAYLLLIGSIIFYSFRLWREQNILLPLGIIIQFLIISSLGPVHSIHILFFGLAIGLLHLAYKKQQIALSLIPRLLILFISLVIIAYHTSAIISDFR